MSFPFEPQKWKEEMSSVPTGPLQSQVLGDTSGQEKQKPLPAESYQ